MLKKMVITGERMAEEEGSVDTGGTDTASMEILVNHLIYYDLICHHLVHLIYYHHLPILALMEKLKRRRIENLFIKVME